MSEKKKRKTSPYHQQMKKLMEEERVGKKRKEAHEKIKSGRPRFPYTEELGQRIADAIATTPRSLGYICSENDDFPNAETLMYWIAYNTDFSKRYLEAKQRQIESHMEFTYDLAEAMTPETTAMRLAQINLRKWHASKLKPKKYGDHIDLQEAIDSNAETIKNLKEQKERLENKQREH